MSVLQSPSAISHAAAPPIVTTAVRLCVRLLDIICIYILPVCLSPPLCLFSKCFLSSLAFLRSRASHHHQLLGLAHPYASVIGRTTNDYFLHLRLFYEKARARVCWGDLISLLSTTVPIYAPTTHHPTTHHHTTARMCISSCCESRKTKRGFTNPPFEFPSPHLLLLLLLTSPKFSPLPSSI